MSKKLHSKNKMVKVVTGKNLQILETCDFRQKIREWDQNVYRPIVKVDSKQKELTIFKVDKNKVRNVDFIMKNPFSTLLEYWNAIISGNSKIINCQEIRKFILELKSGILTLKRMPRHFCVLSFLANEWDGVTIDNYIYLEEGLENLYWKMPAALSRIFKEIKE